MIKATTIVAMLLACPMCWAGQRAFVASVGSDSSTATGCALAAPCRTFAAALGVVDSGGEVVALDTADYASAEITKSVSIVANPGVIALSSGAYVGTDAISVVFRNIWFRGGYVGSTSPLPPMTTAIGVYASATVTVDRCVMTGHFIAVRVEAPAKIRIFDSTINANGYAGLYAKGGSSVTIERTQLVGNAGTAVAVAAGEAGQTTAVTIRDSNLVGNGDGIESGSEYWHAGAATVSVTRSVFTDNGCGMCLQGSGLSMTVAASTFTGNGYGIYALGLAFFKTMGDNVVRHNDTDTMVSPRTMLPPT